MAARQAEATASDLFDIGWPVASWIGALFGKITRLRYVLGSGQTVLNRGCRVVYLRVCMQLSKDHLQAAAHQLQAGLLYVPERANEPLGRARSSVCMLSFVTELVRSKVWQIGDLHTKVQAGFEPSSYAIKMHKQASKDTGMCF